LIPAKKPLEKQSENVTYCRRIMHTSRNHTQLRLEKRILVTQQDLAQPLTNDQYDALTATAIAAGKVIMDIYARPIDVTLKEDRSPVTEADTAAEKVILNDLKKIAPDVPAIAEEAAAAGQIPDVAERFFLVDPLDGTREFISRNGEFTVNIGLIENGVPVAGVVYAPARKQFYRGMRNCGAEMAELSVDDNLAGANWQSIATIDAPAGERVAVASRSHGDAETDAFLSENGVVRTIQAGSSLKFCLLAMGLAQVYPRMGRTMEWDTAAGQAVLEAAGGSVVTKDGNPLRYGKSERGYDNPHFIARA
jgi:3'(2'), 5'-bisphosphate nucleotidase